MARLRTTLPAIGLVLAACTAASDSSTTTSVTSTPSPVAADARLVVVDESGDVVVIRRDGSERVVIADAGDADRGFGQPIWSPDGGMVSFARADADGFAYVVHDLEDGTSSATVVEQFPFYASWSPTSQHVGLLRNGDFGVTFEMVETATGSLSPIGAATPYYFSWSPDGSALAAHAGPDRLIRMTPSGEVTGEIETSPGYLAPTWNESGIVHVNDEDIVVTAADGSETTVANLGGPSLFVVNPQGSMIATQELALDPSVTVALEEAPAPSRNTVSVVDLESGNSSVALAEPAVGFFWSPDGRRLLILAVDGSSQLVNASIWEDGSTREYLGFLPHPAQVRDVYPFFPQYALSMSYWSADSRSFAVVGAIGERSGVWVQDLEAAEPVLVSDGSWVSWSP